MNQTKPTLPHKGHMSEIADKMVEFLGRGLSAQQALVTVPIPMGRSPFELWATIKKTSKYYAQGLAETTSGKVVPRPFKIHTILMADADGYDFKGGPGGQYRREDLQLWINAEGGMKKI